MNPINIIVNGRNENYPLGNIMDYVLLKGLKPETVVVELNGNIIKRDIWREVQLKDNDRMEVVSFVGGG